MKDLPTNQLDPRVKNVWRVNDALWILGITLFFLLPLQLMRFSSDMVGIANIIGVLSIALVVLLLVLCLVVLPPIRYARWRYQISDDFLDIARGIFWRKRFIIPFIRVQNTDTSQGPILRAFGLASVTVSTAAHEHEIPGLDFRVAEQLRDRAAELARIAREDV